MDTTRLGASVTKSQCPDTTTPLGPPFEPTANLLHESISFGVDHVDDDIGAVGEIVALAVLVGPPDIKPAVRSVTYPKRRSVAIAGIRIVVRTAEAGSRSNAHGCGPH